MLQNLLIMFSGKLPFVRDVMDLATRTCTKHILAHCEEFLSLIFETHVCKKHLSNIDSQGQLLEIFMEMMNT